MCRLLANRHVIGLTAVTVLAACAREPVDRPLAHRDRAYSYGPDRFVWCAFGIDTKPKRHPRLDEIAQALQRAKLEGSTLHLFAHVPGGTVDPAALDRVLATAADLGVRLTTYDELSTREVPGSLALSFDDSDLASWSSIRPMLENHHAHVTFFVAFFLGFTAAQREQLHQLAVDGNDIEYHSTAHLDAAKFTAEHGIAEYIATDIVPALDAMRAAGYPTRTFAYPYGARTAATDDALRPYFDHLRAVGRKCP